LIVLGGEAAVNTGRSFGVPALAAVAGREVGPEAEKLCRKRLVLLVIGDAVVAGF